MQIYYNDHLAHYGVGHLDGGHSGRYPWGSGKYTRPDGTLTPAGKRKYKKVVKRYIKEQNSKREVANSALTEKERALKQLESFKASVAKDPVQLYKYRYLFGDEELNKAVNRLATESRLKSLSKDKIKQGSEMLSTYTDYMSKTNTTYKTIKESYATAYEIYKLAKKKMKK